MEPCQCLHFHFLVFDKREGDQLVPGVLRARISDFSLGQPSPGATGPWTGSCLGPRGFLQWRRVKGAICPGPKGPHTEATPLCALKQRIRPWGGHSYHQDRKKAEAGRLGCSVWGPGPGMTLHWAWAGNRVSPSGTTCLFRPVSQTARDLQAQARKSGHNHGSQTLNPGSSVALMD